MLRRWALHAKLDSPFVNGMLPSIQPHGGVAQLVEQRTENPCVGGSNPSLATSLKTVASLSGLGPRLSRRSRTTSTHADTCPPFLQALELLATFFPNLGTLYTAQSPFWPAAQPLAKQSKPKTDRTRMKKIEQSPGTYFLHRYVLNRAWPFKAGFLLAIFAMTLGLFAQQAGAQHLKPGPVPVPLTPANE